MEKASGHTGAVVIETFPAKEREREREKNCWKWQMGSGGLKMKTKDSDKLERKYQSFKIEVLY